MDVVDRQQNHRIGSAVFIALAVVLAEQHNIKYFVILDQLVGLQIVFVLYRGVAHSLGRNLIDAAHDMVYKSGYDQTPASKKMMERTSDTMRSTLPFLL